MASSRECIRFGDDENLLHNGTGVYMDSNLDSLSESNVYDNNAH